VAKHILFVDGERFEVDVASRRGTRISVEVNGVSYAVELGEKALPPATTPSERPPAAAPSAVPQRTSRTGENGASPGAVRAPLAGLVLAIRVREGDRVEAGDPVVVLEAMKMQNEIASEIAGVVAAVRVEPQQAVDQGDVLVEISPSPTATS